MVGVIYYLAWLDDVLTPFYVGQTIQEPKGRWDDHTHDFRGHGRRLKNALQKGIKVDGRTLIMIVMEEVYGGKDDLNEAEARHEQLLISEGYVLKNTAPCGGGRGRQREEQRAAMSETIRNVYKANPDLRLIAAENTSKMWSDEDYAKACREGLAKARAASHSSPLWRAAVTEASREALSKPCLVQDGDVVMMFPSQKEAAAQLGVSRQVLRNSSLNQNTGRHGYLVIDW